MIGQHDHQLVGVTQTQVRQHRGVLQVFSPLLIGKKSLAEGKGEHVRTRSFLKKNPHWHVLHSFVTNSNIRNMWLKFIVLSICHKVIQLYNKVVIEGQGRTKYIRPGS